MEGNVTPEVSVIMPAYNAERYIEEAVESVLNQTLSDLELIIIDDCSKDRTMEIVNRLSQSDPRIHVIKNKVNSGVAKTRNYGLELSRGKYVAFLDSDDIWHKDKLEKQVSLAKKSKADIIYSTYSLMTEQGTKKYNDFVVPETVSFEQMLTCNYFGCSTVLLTKEIVDKYKFNTTFFHEDYVLWLQLLQDGYKAAGVVKSLVDYRVLQTSKSSNKWGSAKQRWNIYRKYLKLSLSKSVVYSIKYAVRGILKYHTKN